MTSLKSIASALICCIGSLLGSGQGSIEKYVPNNAIRIANINPDSTDYSDLEALEKAIGNATIVMLGEQDHGDAATFLAKTRLIQFLHQKKGFDVLAFESDFFSLNEGWQHLKKDKSQIASFLRSNIYPIWSHCVACSTLLYQYIPNTYSTGHPLEITGFDSDLVLDYASNNLISKLDSLLKHLEFPIVGTDIYKSHTLPILDSLKFGFFSNLSNDFYLRSSAILLEIKREMATKLSKDHFWMQVIDNLISANINHQERGKDVIKSFNARDAQMAQNLKWLSLVKYPGKKIIIWAANTHIGKHKDTVMKNKSGQGFTTMGAFFTQDTFLLNRTYILGFTSLEGRAGRLTLNQYTIPAASANSFESWVDTSYQYAFIDFQKFNEIPSNLNERFLMKGFGHFPERESWTSVFDGIFYIKNMYPCK